ncbi:MAG: HAMP domain-containing histidine kinase [Clostridiales bacterium]|nr:HAMP domain-containing histidine kinase [Clostridiales bacterium]
MSKFRKIAILIVAIELLILIGCNFLLLGSLKKDASRQYVVDISRAAEALESEAKNNPGPIILNLLRGDPADSRGNLLSTTSFILKDFNMEDYPSILRISNFNANEVVNNDYAVKDICGTLIRFEYEIKPDLRPLIYMNIGLAFSILTTIGIFIYIGRKVLRPFHHMTDLSVQLAKGNLNAPLNEEKSKYFGRFLWGINMLRDNLESNKEKELALQKDKKTLILSLSHDIKTPLSAIKLYAKALDEDLYDTEEKRKSAISGITNNALEIEKYVGDIVTASKEDFLNLEVTMGEFYINEVLDRIKGLYKDKFSTLHTEFSVDECSNALLSGDPARLEEVLQNILENAIKYGDGKSVMISFSDEEDCRLITVTNSGCSISEDEVPHLFESFYRGSNAEKVGGSGLGLYIARSLMRMMNGDIFAQSKAPESFSVTVVVRKA